MAAITRPDTSRYYDIENDRVVDEPIPKASKDEPAVVNTPALGYSILANLGDEKQITVQCYVDSEEPLAGIHSKLDKAMAVIDRQKAKYRKADALKEIAEMEGALSRLEDDLSRLELEYEKNQQAINDRIAVNIKAISEVNEEAYKHRASGPQGADKARVNALKVENEQLVETKKKAENERDQARENLAVNVGRYHEAIAKKREIIAECEALIGGDG